MKTGIACYRLAAMVFEQESLLTAGEMLVGGKKAMFLDEISTGGARAALQSIISKPLWETIFKFEWPQDKG